MNPVGLWTLHSDWGPKANYHWTPLYFNFDGTFAYIAGANEGTWTQIDDNIIWDSKSNLTQKTTPSTQETPRGISCLA